MSYMSNRALKASGSDTRVLSINVRAAALTWCWACLIREIKMSEIRINRIKIKNYRSFGEEQLFIFPDANYKKPIAIIGYNNSGKTNLMNCILYGIGNKFVQANTFEKNDLHNLSYDNNINIKIDIQGSPFGWDSYRNTEKTITGIYTLKTEMENGELKANMTPSMFGMNKYYNIFYINFHDIKNEINIKKTNWGNLASFLSKHIRKIVDNDTNMKSKKENYESEVKTATNKVLDSSKLKDFVLKTEVTQAL